MFNGHPTNVNRRIRATIRRAAKHDLVVTSTTDGGHSRGSWHYVIPGRNREGCAVDFGFTAANLHRFSADQRRAKMVAFQRAEYARARRMRFLGWMELIGPENGLCILQGRPAGLAEGTALEQAHDNHVHIARR